jgi:hypothetical protein
MNLSFNALRQKIVWPARRPVAGANDNGGRKIRPPSSLHQRASYLIA